MVIFAMVFIGLLGFGLILPVGVLVVFVQNVGIGWLTARYSDRALIVGSMAMMAAALVLWGLTPQCAGAPPGAYPSVCGRRCAEHGAQQCSE